MTMQGVTREEAGARDREDVQMGTGLGGGRRRDGGMGQEKGDETDVQGRRGGRGSGPELERYEGTLEF